MQLVSKISNLCDPDPPTSQTDGQTDGRHAISVPRYALVHRAVKTSGADVSLGSFNQSYHSECPGRNLGLGLCVSPNYIESSAIKITNSKRKLLVVVFFYFFMFRVSKRLNSLAQVYEIRQQFPEIVGKIGIFL